MTDYVYKHRQSEEHPGWKAELVAQIAERGPQLKGVIGVISNGVDIHMWIRVGDNPKGSFVTLEYLPSGQAGLDLLQTLLDSGTGVPIGINRSDPPNIWVARTAEAGTSPGIHEYKYFDGASDHFQDQVENWLNERRPELSNIWAVLSGGKDLHMFVVPGGDESPATYQLRHFPEANAVAEVSRILRDGIGKPLGVNQSDPPSIWSVVRID